jgi:hypothetical protein
VTTRRLSLLLLATVVLSGCTDTVGGRPAARFSLPVHNFPDKGGYTAVDPESFHIRDGNPELGFVFTTPTGLVCGMGSFPGWESAGAECTGLRPDRGPGSWTVDAERFGATTIETSAMPQGTHLSTANPNKLLPQRHYVVDSVDTLCLVTQESAVACHVGAHGFILTADTTTTF